MAERHRAPPDVHARGIEPQHPVVGDRHDRKGFIDLPEIDVVLLPADLAEQPLDRPRRRGGEPLGRLGVPRRADDAGHRLPAARLAATSAAASTSAAAPSLIDEAFPAVTVPSFWKAGRSVASFSMSPRPGSSSSATILGAPFFCAISTGTISARNFPSATARSAPLVRLDGERVLVGAGDPLFLRAELGAVAHVDVAVGVPQAVMDQGIDHLRVAQPVSLARLGQQIRRVAHRLHAARHHHVVLAGGDGVARRTRPPSAPSRRPC